MKKIFRDEAPPFGRVPYDLIQWMDETSLAILAMESGHAMSLGRSAFPRQDDSKTGFLLGLVTYCYARGIFTLADIVSVGRGAKHGWGVAANPALTHSMVREFLQPWRQIIKQNLITVFREAWRRRYAVHAAGMSCGLGSNVPSLHELDALRQFVCEADERLFRAIRCSRDEFQIHAASRLVALSREPLELSCAV
jgi:hypothetical protein